MDAVKLDSHLRHLRKCYLLDEGSKYYAVSMFYDPLLTDRIRNMFLARPGASEKSMFGGVGFLVNGNMSVGVWKDLLVVRLSKEEGTAALEEDHVRMMDITGKPMRGWIFVEPEGIEDDEKLLEWVEKGYQFAKTLKKKY